MSRLHNILKELSNGNTFAATGGIISVISTIEGLYLTTAKTYHYCDLQTNPNHLTSERRIKAYHKLNTLSELMNGLGYTGQQIETLNNSGYQWAVNTSLQSLANDLEKIQTP